MTTRERRKRAPVASARSLRGSPVYRQADRDLDFLGCDDTHAVRLQLDYLKAELLLERQGVKHTIVVFGGKRVVDAAAARRRAAALARRLAADPRNESLRRKSAVADRIVAKSRYYAMARELGRLVGRAGDSVERGRIVLMTGGGPGIMEAVNRGAHDVGAKSIGLNIALPREQYPNRYVSPELCFKFRYFSTRKLHFLRRARALVAFPGGYGTLDELFETLNLVQSGAIEPVPVVMVGEAYWRRVLDFDFLVAEGVIDAKDRELVSYAETAPQIWRTILKWHAANGTPLS
jgi:uncharacterized protein (TIGR00730 family)